MKRGHKRFLSFQIDDELLIVSDEKLNLNAVLYKKFEISTVILDLLQMDISTNYKMLMKKCADK